jgi:hypothetical protein
MSWFIDNIPGIPDGYVMITGPEEQPYVVPQFMVPALHQIFDGYREKQNMDVFGAAGSVSTIFHWIALSDTGIRPPALITPTFTL